MPGPGNALSTRSQTWLLAAVGLLVLPHLPRLPWWIGLLAVGVGLFKLVLLRRPRHRPPRPLLALLTVAASAGVFFSYGTLLGKQAGVALLVVMLALKLLELHTVRDARLLVYLGYFLVVTNFLFTQTIPIALYMFVATLVITATLSVITHSSRERPAGSHLRLAAVLLVQALPIMLVLFVFFPRVAGPLWGLPRDAYAGMTGLSDSMTPGAISSLAQSGATAFRVEFFGPAPEPALRYWRGPVLWHTDGRTWSPGRTGSYPRQRPEAVQNRDQALRYAITLEGHDKPWLLALDLPVEISQRALYTVDFQWLAYRPVRERIRYEATSWPHYHTGPLDPPLRKAALQLPEHVSPRVQALARGWRDRADSDSAVVQQALEHFHTQPFVYTLQPPLLGDDPVDDFLFGTRRGFCEHYAAAFVVLMRSAGIPARVVTGYQGGEYNPVGDYWLIRQADAHAWAEVWLPDTGWQRVDPTAAVAPERIEHALDPGRQAAGAPARFRLAETGLLLRGWRQLQFAVDSVNNHWNQWVLSYGPQRQLELLAALGFRQASWREMALTLLLLTGGCLLGIALWMLVRTPAPADPVLQAWQRFCSRLGRLGVQRAPGEGPRDLARRALAARPEVAAQVNAITGLYIALRYGRPRPDSGKLKQLRQQIRRFPQRTG
jgi:transglutaminase-like putative cysteine protease